MIRNKDIKNNFYLINLIFIFSLLLSISSTQSFAFGMSPSDKRINYEPDALVNLEFSIINSEATDVDIGLSAQGDLAKYVLFEDEMITLKSNEAQKTIKVGLKLPENLTPGTHAIFLKATPLIQNSGEMMQAFVSPIVPIYIRVPYPSKYAEVRLKVEDVLDANPVPVILEFDNLGNEDITSAGGTIYIYNNKNELVNTLNAPLISIPANTYAKSEANPRPILKKGNYLAKAFAKYDDVDVNTSLNFTVGNPKVIVYGFYTQEIYTGIINPVEFELQSDWSEPLQVKAFLEINGLQTEVPLINLGPLEQKKITGYLDAANVPLGESEVKLTLLYSDQIKTQTFRVSIGDEPPLSFGGKDRTDLVVGFIIFILILVMLIVWLYIRKKSKEDDDEDEIGSQIPNPPNANI